MAHFNYGEYLYTIASYRKKAGLLITQIYSDGSREFFATNDRRMMGETFFLTMEFLFLKHLFQNSLTNTFFQCTIRSYSLERMF
jgi:hypothetical protein